MQDGALRPVVAGRLSLPRPWEPYQRAVDVGRGRVRSHAHEQARTMDRDDCSSTSGHLRTVRSRRRSGRRVPGADSSSRRYGLRKRRGHALRQLMGLGTRRRDRPARDVGVAAGGPALAATPCAPLGRLLHRDDGLQPEAASAQRRPAQRAAARLPHRVHTGERRPELRRPRRHRQPDPGRRRAPGVGHAAGAGGPAVGDGHPGVALPRGRAQGGERLRSTEPTSATWRP